MPRLSSTLQVLDLETKRWLEDEYRRTFVQQRRMLCGHADILTIRFPTILCESCFSAKVDGVFVTYRGPDVLPQTWAADLANFLDDYNEDSVVDERDSPRCQSCRRNLHRQALYVETEDLQERLSISDETTAIEPCKKRKAEVLRLYGRKCFACGSSEGLGIDHIEPRSKGGNAAFENLQPLCEKCGNAKRNRLPCNVVVIRDPWSDQN